MQRLYTNYCGEIPGSHPQREYYVMCVCGGGVKTPQRYCPLIVVCGTCSVTQSFASADHGSV